MWLECLEGAVEKKLTDKQNPIIRMILNFRLVRLKPSTNDFIYFRARKLHHAKKFPELNNHLSLSGSDIVSLRAAVLLKMEGGAVTPTTLSTSMKDSSSLTSLAIQISLFSTYKWENRRLNKLNISQDTLYQKKMLV